MTLFLASTSPCRASKATKADEASVRYTGALSSLVVAPKPAYPLEARRSYFQGHGLYLVRFDVETGRVREVTVIRSTGHAVLDEESVNVLHQWQSKPHTLKTIEVPINFELKGEAAAILRAANENLLYAPRPRYPLAAAAHGVAGKGRFELIIDPGTGLVTDVRVLETTHDGRLDAAAVKAFRQWRFKPNTVRSLVVPFSFSLGYG